MKLSIFIRRRIYKVFFLFRKVYIMDRLLREGITLEFHYFIQIYQYIDFLLTVCMVVIITELILEWRENLYRT